MEVTIVLVLCFLVGYLDLAVAENSTGILLWNDKWLAKYAFLFDTFVLHHIPKVTPHEYGRSTGIMPGGGTLFVPSFCSLWSDSRIYRDIHRKGLNFFLMDAD